MGHYNAICLLEEFMFMCAIMSSWCPEVLHTHAVTQSSKKLFCHVKGHFSLASDWWMLSSKACPAALVNSKND